MSNNLNLSQVTASQNQKEVTINAQAGEIDAAITVKADFTITDTNARTLSSSEFRRNFLFHITDGAPAPNGDITLTVPAIARGVFAILNTTSFPVTVTIAGQSVTAPEVASGATTPSLLTCDGVNVRLASSAGGGGGSTDFNKVSAGHVVNATLTGSFDLTGYFNRGLVHTIKITETGGVSTGTYDVRLYSKDTFLAADKQYGVDAIDSTLNGRVYQDDLVVFYRDADGTDELHLQIDNNDATQNMTFTIEIDAEVFETGVGGGGGDVVGPASAVTGRIATFNGTTGKLIQDGGKLGADLVTGPASAIADSLVLFNGTSGKIIKDSARIYQEAISSFTPDLRFGGASVGITYDTQSLVYARIGNLVHINGIIVLTNKGSSTGNAEITLPFTSAGGVPGFVALPFFGNLASLNGMVIGKVESAQSHLVMFHPNANDGTATGMSILTEANFTNTSTIQFTGIYAVA